MRLCFPGVGFERSRRDSPSASAAARGPHSVVYSRSAMGRFANDQLAARLAISIRDAIDAVVPDAYVMRP